VHRKITFSDLIYPLNEHADEVPRSGVFILHTVIELTLPRRQQITLLYMEAMNRLGQHVFIK
jgi:hypothetical protein